MSDLTQQNVMPVFTISGNDEFASAAVLAYEKAVTSDTSGLVNPEYVAQVQQFAQDLLKWQTENGASTPTVLPGTPADTTTVAAPAAPPDATVVAAPADGAPNDATGTAPAATTQNAPTDGTAAPQPTADTTGNAQPAADGTADTTTAAAAQTNTAAQPGDATKADPDQPFVVVPKVVGIAVQFMPEGKVQALGGSTDAHAAIICGNNGDGTVNLQVFPNNSGAPIWVSLVPYTDEAAGGMCWQHVGTGS